MILKPSEFKRKVFFIIFDTLIIFFASFFAFALRFDFSIPDEFIPSMYITTFILVFLRVTLYSSFRVYDISWRHFGFKDMTGLVYATIFGTMVLLIISYLLRNFGYVIPRSIIPIEFFISLFLVLALRVSKRLYLERNKINLDAKNTIVIADLDRANTILRTIQNSQSDYYPVAIVNDKERGKKLNGIEVYSWDILRKSSLVCEVAIVDEKTDVVKIYDLLSELGVHSIRIASEYGEYGAELKDISVEDLLARHPKDLDKKAIESFIVGKKVLITGAGGSIGSEIARQCSSFGASKLILLDHSEFNLYQIAEELAESAPVLVMQSVVNRELLDETFKKHQPDIVIHAAAYKHVPLVEDNISEAILNNVVGTKNVIDCSIENGVEKFLLISTDKAVRPTNVMGTTKRICELYLQNVERKDTEVVAVRFGNVLGSSGSVIPKFKAQLAAGGPITVTHPDITRYFMLIPEACELVLQAASIGKGGEIFILDMGEPVKIVDLAKKMIDLSGRDDISIEFSGLRPGEKLYEELLISESDMTTEYESITVAGKSDYAIEKLNRDIEELVSTEKKLEKLKEIVPEFNHMTK
ncbi:MAG: polysaccharide biosynthesis protein [Campylobacterales bacterium]|nr:polysaccharide biosynthesis protein [Campylobacterales bacterium]